MGAKRKQSTASERDRDTIPARPSRKPGANSSTDLPNVSGTRVASRSREQRVEPADEAHAEMERAVARGVCRILNSNLSDDGTYHQWSAWLTEQRHLVVQEWHRPRLGTWKTGPSFVMDREATRDLVELLAASVKQDG
jgi:hypothetical protein